MSRRKVLWCLAAAGLCAALWYATAMAAASTDVMVQLTSGPITAHSGQQVTHTVEISAADGDTSGETKTQMTFSTTVPLEGVTAKTTDGTCHVVSAVSVTCDVNGAAPADVPVQVTITGQIPAATPAGQVVYNVANIVTEGTDPDMSNNTSSNAYVLTASGLASDGQPGAPRHSAAMRAAASNVDSSWGTPAVILAGVIAAGAVQVIVMALMRRKTRQRQSAKHRHGAKPWGYRPRHATTPWRRLMAKEIVLPKWTVLRQRHVSQHRVIEQRSYRGSVGLPAAAAVLLVTLALTALPAFADAAHKPHPPTASEQASHVKKDKHRPKSTSRPQPSPSPSVSPSVSPSPTATAETATPAPAAPSKVDSAPVVVAPTQDMPPIPDVEPTDAPTTGHAKMVSALNRGLRRAEYLRQMSACTNADLTTARARVAQLEQNPDGAGKALEDAQGTVAVLEMGLNATDAELKRAEARVDKLSEVSTVWTKETSAHLAKPVEGEQTSPFGNRFDPYYKRWQLHAGLDLSAVTGTPIHAAAAGTVKQAGWNGGYGNYTCLDHGQVKGEELTTCYAHQSEIDVQVGQKVAAGQTIGQVGSTGASTGPHLHFEVRLDGRAVDPAPWLGGAL